jgi:hypothetical protein
MNMKLSAEFLLLFKKNYFYMVKAPCITAFISPIKQTCMKTIIFIAASLLIFSSASHAQLPFSDGFESGNFITGGWTVSGGAQISTQNPNTGVYCAEGPATWGLVKTIPSVSVPQLAVEFAAKASQTNTTCMVFRIKDTTPGGTSAGMFMDNAGNIMVVNGTASLPISTYSPGTWYVFRFELDMNTHTYDVFIDGILKADDFAFFSAGFLQPYLFTWSSVAASGSAWIDDVNIYALTTGLDELSANAAGLYPNPVHSVLHVSAGKADNGTIAFYDMAGALLLEKKMQTANTGIDLSFLRQGVYLAVLRDSGNRILFSGRIVKL